MVRKRSRERDQEKKKKIKLGVEIGETIAHDRRLFDKANKQSD